MSWLRRGALRIDTARCARRCFPAMRSAGGGASAPDLDRIAGEGAEAFKEQGFALLRGTGLLGERMCAEQAELARQSVRGGRSFLSFERHTVYQEDEDPSLPPSHCRNALQESAKHIVDMARLPPSSELTALYRDPRMVGLVRRVVGLPEIHTSACPYNAAYLNVYEETHGLGWHFDRSEFGVNLLLSAPSAGGVFEFHHNTRSGEDMIAYGAVQDILERGSGHPGVAKVGPLLPGDIVIFNGRLSMHRVTPVQGELPRINAIFTYEKSPGVKTNTYALKKFFGRDAV